MDDKTKLLWNALVRIAERCSDPDKSSSSIDSLISLRKDIYSEVHKALMEYQSQQAKV